MAYAAVISLMQTMERLAILYQSKNLLSQLETIFIDGKIPNLNSFLETIEYLPTVKIFFAASERRVIDAVQKFEDLIDSHLLDQLSECSSSSTDGHQISFSLLFSEQLPKVKEELSSLLTTLSIITDEQKQQQQRYCFASSDYNTVNQQQNLLAGLDNQIKRIKEWILRPESSLLFTSVVGMTGIGKTTLVQKVYSDPSVVDEFETRLFVHIGLRYNRSEEIMWLVLYQLGITSDKFLKRDYVKQLSEPLSDKKYLIVLEDVWAGIHAWHDLQYGGFPDNGKRSRVIILSQIDRYVVSGVIVLTLLKDNKSWKLLRQTAFSSSEDKCSRELEKFGKTIAINCERLPATIIQVGENLRGKSFQEWKTLSEKEDPLVITRDDDTPLSEALYFSYMMLSQGLKLCFLYMGVFPKNYVISRSKLVKLWVCESFVADLSRLFSTPEKISGASIDQLIHQSVVLKEKSTALNLYNAKKCRLHFTFRSLCVNEAKSEKFFHILKYSNCKPQSIRSHKLLCAHNNVVLASAQMQKWRISFGCVISSLLRSKTTISNNVALQF